MKMHRAVDFGADVLGNDGGGQLGADEALVPSGKMEHTCELPAVAGAPAEKRGDRTTQRRRLGT